MATGHRLYRQYHRLLEDGEGTSEPQWRSAKAPEKFWNDHQIENVYAL